MTARARIQLGLAAFADEPGRLRYCLKDRGLDEQFADAVPPALSILYQHGLLVQKTSRHSNKYALNPERREEIYKILRQRRIANVQLSTVLHRDRRVISVRHFGPP